MDLEFYKERIRFHESQLLYYQGVIAQLTKEKPNLCPITDPLDILDKFTNSENKKNALLEDINNLNDRMKEVADELNQSRIPQEDDFLGDSNAVGDIWDHKERRRAELKARQETVSDELLIRQLGLDPNDVVSIE
jgi:hypothetical protein